MPRTNRSGFQDGFMEIVQEQLEHSRQEVRDLDEQIADLQRERATAAKRVSQLEDLLGENQSPARSEGVEFNPLPAQTPGSLRPIADADTVVELIREHGQAMHYRDIHQILIDQGFEIGGRGQADTLLSRYFNDPRLVRIARGTYGLADPQATDVSAKQQPIDETAKIEPERRRMRRERPTIQPRQVRLPKNAGLRELAAEVLRQAGNPLHYEKITERILQSGAWTPITKTPKDSVNSAMVVDIQKNGPNSVFVRPERGIYGLREWKRAG